MADLESSVQSAEPASVAAVSEVSPTPVAEPKSVGLNDRMNGFLRSVFGQRPEGEAASAPVETEPKDSAEEKVPAVSAAEPEEKPFAVVGKQTFKTEAEFVAHQTRQVQAETDRRTAKAQAAATKAERAKLAKEDPYTFAKTELERQQAEESDETEAAKTGSLLVQTAGAFDGALYFPIINLVDEKERASLIEGAPEDPIAYRAHVVTKAVEAIKKAEYERGKADGTKAVRNNPAFRKEVLAETRVKMAGPDLVEGAATSSAPTDMNEKLRAFVRR